MRTKCELSSAVIFLFFSVVLVTGVTYLSWRWIFTLNILTSPVVTFTSYALYLAEVLTLFVFTNFALILLKTCCINKIQIDNRLQNDYTKDVFKDGKLVTFKNFCPSVDIFICTLDEEVDLLSTTIAACKNIDYPNKTVYVLDDGRREDVRTLSELLGCKYIIRDTNKGYKAGNINNALSLTNSELVVIFDADHVAASTFLRETVYNFVDEKVALVQTPQHFCNPDAFQKNLGLANFLSNEQDMFYRVIEPSLNEFDSVFCGGTNIVIRRKHLEAVGNFPETTVTEDSLLGLKFHAHGYRVVYYNRPIAIGLSASSFEEYIKQRSRWAKGNIQIFKNVENWKYFKNLKPMQAFFYISGILYFFTPLARLIFLICPVLFLFFDISPVLVLFYQIFAFQICYFVLKFSFIFTNCIKIKNVIIADVYDLVTSIFTSWTILKTVFVPEKLSKSKFFVTNKSFSKIKSNRSYALVMILILTVLVFAELQGFYDLMFSDVYSTLAVWANLFWNSINIVVSLFAIQVVLEKPEKRTYQRIRASEEISAENNKREKFKINIYDISRSGLSFFAPNGKELESNQELKIDMNGYPTEIEVIGSQKKGKSNIYKSMLRKPITLFKLTKRKIARIEKFVKLAYKSPDLWDDYFREKED